MKVLLMLGIIVLAVVFAPGASAKEEKQAPGALPDAVFAFANESGTELLASGPEEEDGKTAVKAISQAICPDNKIFDITFSRHQARSGKDSGRQTSRNFGNLEGDVFRVLHGKLKADDTCLLVKRNYMQNKHLVSLKTAGMTPEGFPAPPAKCDSRIKSSVPNQQNRAPIGCWQLAQVGGNGHLLAVHYSPRGKDLLAALILQVGEKSMVYAMPAKANSISAWREGDGGKFDPAVFTPLFVLQNEKDGSWEISILWSGEEGGNFSVYRSQGGLLEQVMNGYRYWSPE